MARRSIQTNLYFLYYRHMLLQRLLHQTRQLIRKQKRLMNRRRVMSIKKKKPPSKQFSMVSAGNLMIPWYIFLIVFFCQQLKETSKKDYKLLHHMRWWIFMIALSHYVLGLQFNGPSHRMSQICSLAAMSWRFSTSVSYQIQQNGNHQHQILNQSS